MENNWVGMQKEPLKIYRGRLRGRAIQALMDLALIAEREPEDQLAQIFTPITVGPLMRALTGRGSYVISSRHYEIAKTMLNVAATRLEALIDTDYRPIVVPYLEKDISLLRMLQAPATPREGLEKRSPDTIKAQRRQAEKERKLIDEEYLGVRFVPDVAP